MAQRSEHLAFARDLAADAGELALRYFGRDPLRQQKSDGSWVTEADREVEARVRTRIAEAYPGHNVLGEEEGLSGAGGGDPVDGAPTWVVDPIDGTHNFMAGIPLWATLVALQVDEEPVVGVAHAPAIGETYHAAIGAGAFMNDERIHVDPIASLEEATALHAGTKGFYEVGLDHFHESLVRRAWRTRGFGDFWGHMLVARGAAHVMVEPELAAWDVAALEPIVREAGGTLTHLDGRRWYHAGSCLTTCGTLHDEIVALVQETSPDWTEGLRSIPGDVRPAL